MTELLERVKGGVQALIRQERDAPQNKSEPGFSQAELDLLRRLPVELWHVVTMWQVHGGVPQKVLAEYEDELTPEDLAEALCLYRRHQGWVDAHLEKLDRDYTTLVQENRARAAEIR